MKPNIIFMGTPIFACAILERLIQEGYPIIGVVSQPDKKVGRKQIVTSTPIKELALKHEIPVYQPIHIKDAMDILMALKADLIVTCAYGQIIPVELLEFPTYGSINVHASLLPALRGGAPIHKSIMYGHKESGISIMRMVKKMDAGAVMAQQAVPIEESDTTATLSEKLMIAGADLLIDSIPKIVEGTAVFIEQDESKATFAWNISKEEEKIDFHQDVEVVYNHMRSLIPAPVSYALWNEKKVKFHAVRMLKREHYHEPGEVIGLMQGGFAIAAEHGYLLIDEIQLEGKGKCDAKSFNNGAGRNLLHTILT